MSEQPSSPYMNNIADIHSHIVYGADDGASSLDEAIAVLKLDRDEGATAVFATPHYGKENIYTPEASGVMRNFERLKERAAQEVPEVSLYLGTEWYCAYTLARRIRQRLAFRMNETDYILTEFLESGGLNEPADRILTNLKELRDQGFRPILAHAERYDAIQRDWDLAKRIRDLGVLLQVNAYDLYLNSGLKTRDLAQWLAKERLISFLGSDAHGLPPKKRSPRMKEGVRWLYENTDRDYADDVVRRNAEKYLKIRKLEEEETDGKPVDQ